MAKQALSDHKAFRTEAKELVKSLRDRFEAMMCSGRRMPRQDFEAFFLGHPLVRQLGRKLIWAEYVLGRPPVTFRIAEDGTLAGPDDAKLVLGDGTIGVVHPAEIAADTIARWVTIAGDYEVLQPFEQLTRDVARDAKEARAAIRAVSKRDIAVDRVRALLGRGWTKGAVENGGFLSELRRPLGRTELAIRFDGPGLPVSGKEISHVRIASMVPAPDASTVIERSELVRDLRTLLD